MVAALERLRVQQGRLQLPVDRIAEKPASKITQIVLGGQLPIERLRSTLYLFSRNTVGQKSSIIPINTAV
jgi:hypothetical protein